MSFVDEAKHIVLCTGILAIGRFQLLLRIGVGLGDGLLAAELGLRLILLDVKNCVNFLLRVSFLLVLHVEAARDFEILDIYVITF